MIRLLSSFGTIRTGEYTWRSLCYLCHDFLQKPNCSGEKGARFAFFSTFASFRYPCLVTSDVLGTPRGTYRNYHYGTITTKLCVSILDTFGVMALIFGLYSPNDKPGIVTSCDPM